MAGAALGAATEAMRTAASIVDAGARAARPMAVAGASVAAPLRRVSEDLLRRWDQAWEGERPEAESLAGAVASEATRRTVDAILDQLDLTAIVHDRVDLDAVVGTLDLDAVVDRIDVDAIVARVDVDAIAARIDPNAIAGRVDVSRIIERIDLSALALEVIDRIDLPEIDPGVHRRGRLRHRAHRPIGVDLGRPGRGEVRRPSPRPAARRGSDGGAVSTSVRYVPAEAREVQGASAGIVTRVAANAIDVGVAAVIVTVAYLAWAAGLFLLRGRDFTFPTVPWGAAAAALLVVLAVLFALAWGTSGQTYGDHVLGIRVVTRDGEGLGPIHALARAVLCVPFPILLFWAAVSRERRSVQDLVLRTKVVYDWHPPGRQTTRSARV